MNDTGERSATTIRPPASAELLIDSLDRYARGYPPAGGATTSSDWRTNFQQNILYGYFTRLAITQIQFWWNLPTILAGYNDTFTISITAGAGAPRTFNVNLDTNFYTPTELAAEIQASLIAADAAGWVCQFADGRFGIQANGLGYTWEIVPPVNNVQARCLSTLGFVFPNLVIAGNAVLRGSPPTMVPTRYIDIISNYLTKYQRVKDSTTLQSPTVSNIIARVYPCPPNTQIQTTGDYAGAMTDLPGNSVGSHPFVICIDYNTPKHIKWSPDEALANFDLQLRDGYGELIPWNAQNSCEYQLTVLASES